MDIPDSLRTDNLKVYYSETEWRQAIAIAEAFNKLSVGGGDGDSATSATAANQEALLQSIGTKSDSLNTSTSSTTSSLFSYLKGFLKELQDLDSRLSAINTNTSNLTYSRSTISLNISPTLINNFNDAFIPLEFLSTDINKSGAITLQLVPGTINNNPTLIVEGSASSNKNYWENIDPLNEVITFENDTDIKTIIIEKVCWLRLRIRWINQNNSTLDDVVGCYRA